MSIFREFFKHFIFLNIIQYSIYSCIYTIHEIVSFFISPSSTLYQTTMFYFNLLWFNIYRLSSSVYLFVVNCRKFCYAQLSFIKWNNITLRWMYLFSLLFLLPLPVCVCVKIIGSLTRIWPSYKNLYVTIYQVECFKFLIFPCSSFYLLSSFFLFSSFTKCALASVLYELKRDEVKLICCFLYSTKLKQHFYFLFKIQKKQQQQILLIAVEDCELRQQCS